ncbi:MAG: ferric reductase-like transmembrane domain-containing protein [Candidatus Woykebacteria bacterium]
MIFLIKNIRKIILITSAAVALLIYLFVKTNIESADLQKIRLAQIYALTAVTYLYLALIASPLYKLFPRLPTKSLHLVARRGIGVSAFFFALLHSQIAFWWLLGGFSGLGFLSNAYLKAISLSFIALLILSSMAATSFNWAVQKLGRRWKMLHRLVYIAATLIGIHALMLGTHFIDLSASIPKIFFVALSVLLILEAIRFDRFLAEKFLWLPKVGLSLALVVGLITYASFYLKPPHEGTTSIGIHSQHIKLAEEAQKGTAPSTTTNNSPGLDGDKTKRYTVNFDHQEGILPKQKTTLRFKVFDASSGSPVSLFKAPWEKTFHLIIVDGELAYFDHIHPVQKGAEFVITTSFPHDSTYRLYANFQPFGGIEQQIAFSLQVGEKKEVKASQPVDHHPVKIFGDYEVELSTGAPLKAADMSLGKQKISFTIKDANTKEPVTNLKPYLNAFGHLVMIKQDNYDYLHVHPYNLTPPVKDASGGPTVEFLPIGIYGPFKAGVYRAFAQFNHNGKLFVAYFTVKVE